MSEPFVRFIEVFADYFDLSEFALNPETRLVDDLGFDSLMYAEIELLFYETAAHDVPDDLIASLATIGDVYHYWWTYFSDSSDQVL
jgi:acyl carrier protein